MRFNTSLYPLAGLLRLEHTGQSHLGVSAPALSFIWKLFLGGLYPQFLQVFAQMSPSWWELPSPYLTLQCCLPVFPVSHWFFSLAFVSGWRITYYLFVASIPPAEYQLQQGRLFIMAVSLVSRTVPDSWRAVGEYCWMSRVPASSRQGQEFCSSLISPALMQAVGPQ